MRLEEVLVAILGEQAASADSPSSPAGAGLLVAPDLVLTCAHVVNAALKLASHNAGRPRGAVAVRLHTFPSPISLATVDAGDDAWSDPPAHRAPGADLCLLRLKTPFPSTPAPRLLDGVDLVDRSFRTAGYPENWDLDIANGIIRTYDRTRLFLLRPEPAAAATFAVQPPAGLFSKEERPAGVIHSGFSGAPVEVEERIAGLVAQSRSRPAEITSYMIPVAAFPRRLAGLIDDVFRTYREALDAVAKPERIRVQRSVVRQSEQEALLEPTAAEVEAAAANADDETLRGLADEPPMDATLPPHLQPVRPLPPLRPFAMLPGYERPAYAFSALEDKARILERRRSAQGIDRTLEKALAETHKIVLLGDPGIGKSTALRDLERADSQWIPIRLDLRLYDGSDELEVLFAKRINEILRRRRTSLTPKPADAAAFLQAQLLREDGRDFIFLLDGLDEVKPEFHEKVRQAIKGVLAYHHRCVISCRITGYESIFDGEAVPYVLEELAPGDIQNYLVQSLGEERGLSLFSSQIGGDPQLLNLAANPLLLSLIAKIAEFHPQARIPAKRAELFDAFVDDLPLMKSREGARLPIPRDLVISMLEALGFAMLEHATLAAGLAEIRTWNIPTSDHTLDATLAEAHECRLLLSDGESGGSVQFIHPLFREYFAARLLRQRFAQLRAGIAEGDGQLQTLVAKIWTPRWDQTVLMLATIADRPVDFIVRLANLTRAGASVGSLYMGVTYDFYDRLRASLGVATRCRQLLDCWKVSQAAADPKATEAVLRALRAVVRYCRGAFLAGQPLAVAEVQSAIDGLMQIGDPAAIPDLETFLAIRSGPYRFGGPTLASILKYEGPFSSAQLALDRLREKSR
jgi:hypothetical protein